MTAPAIAPGSAEWAGLISPSKVAAIMGVSRWESPFRLWHRMKHALDPTWHARHGYGDPQPEPHKDIFDTGHSMELCLADLWKKENQGWQLSPGEVQVATNSFGFPAIATVDRRARRGTSRRPVEFKSARSLEEWGVDFSDEAPADYLVQVTTQMLFTEWTDHAGHLTVMGPYLEHHTYEIPFDEDLAHAILQRCTDWWHSLHSDEQPALDDRVETYELVRELHPDIDGTAVQIDPELAYDLLTSERDKKTILATNTGLKSQFLSRMKHAQVAKVGTVKVADRRKNGHGTVSLYPSTKALEKLENNRD